MSRWTDRRPARGRRAALAGSLRCPCPCGCGRQLPARRQDAGARWRAFAATYDTAMPLFCMVLKAQPVMTTTVRALLESGALLRDDLLAHAHNERHFGYVELVDATESYYGALDAFARVDIEDDAA